MSTEDHERLTEIFHRAAELDSSRRARYLDEACGDDAELRAEVESLLRHDAEVPEILKDGAIALHAVEEITGHPERVGRYRILEKLGEGGMGIVYRAEQDEPIRRQVAIKLIKVGIETRQVVARFESERQALALMNHPCIAQVLDAGASEEGRPYFAMEYVDGEPITDFCDRHELGLRGRLELFLQVCEGVQHAHHNAIIHRDIKPSNILIAERDGRRVPKIIDFGVAKALDHRLSNRTMYTELGQLLGTPEYMSPEQAAMDRRHVDTRTDVYSLGVLLYELISGTHPFDREALRHSAPEEIRRRIREELPPRPSTRVARPGSSSPPPVGGRATDRRSLARRLEGDLDWITMKALEKEPHRRYDSAAELASDIRRHLNREPVLAGPPGILYIATKAVARNRGKVAIAALIAVLVLGSAIAGTIQTDRIAREAERAREEALTADLVSEFLVELFDTSPRVDARFSRGDSAGVVRRAVENLENEFGVRPLLQARMLHTVGDLSRALGHSREARPLLEEAYASLGRLLGENHTMTLNAARSLAEYYMDRAHFDEAEGLYDDTLRRRRLVQGEDHLDTLRAESDLGYLYKLLGRNAEAEKRLGSAVEGLRRALGERDEETLVAAGFLAGVYLEQARYEDARTLLVELVEAMSAVLGEAHFETKVALYNLGCADANLGRHGEAIDSVARSVHLGFVIRGSLLADPHLDPLHGDPRFDVVVKHHSLNNSRSIDLQTVRADLEVSHGRYEKAAEYYLEALEAMRRIGLGSSGKVGMLYYKLADVYLHLGRYDDAVPLFEECLEAERAAWGSRPTDQSDWLWRVALSRWKRGDLPDPRPMMREVITTYERHDALHSLLAYYRAGYSAFDGDREGAIRHLTTALDHGYEWTRWMINDPVWESLRGDPDYEAILAELKERYGDV